MNSIKKKLDSQADTESQIQFPEERFDWTDTQLTETEEQSIKDILVDYHDILTRHRTDIRMKTEFKVKLTPKDDKTDYDQSLPTPVDLKDDLNVELALMHKYGIFTVLPFSQYARPKFAQRRPNGEVRLFVDLRKFNTLIADDYTNKNHPVSATDFPQNIRAVFDCIHQAGLKLTN